MTNAELVARRQRRILIPSVYRMEYVGSLKRLTNHPDGYIRVMDYAQQLSQRIDFAELTEARRQLESGNAFKDPADGVKLTMPAKPWGQTSEMA